MLESDVVRALRSGETLRYQVTPVYSGDQLVPDLVIVRARGTGGFYVEAAIENTR